VNRSLLRLDYVNCG